MVESNDIDKKSGIVTRTCPLCHSYGKNYIFRAYHKKDDSNKKDIPETLIELGCLTCRAIYFIIGSEKLE